jgi:hypothetical protein
MNMMASLSSTSVDGGFHDIKRRFVTSVIKYTVVMYARMMGLLDWYCNLFLFFDFHPEKKDWGC